MNSNKLALPISPPVSPPMTDQFARVNQWRWQIEDPNLFDATPGNHRWSTGPISPPWLPTQHGSSSCRPQEPTLVQDVDQSQQSVTRNSVNGPTERRILPIPASTAAANPHNIVADLSMHIPEAPEQAMVGVEEKEIHHSDDEMPEDAPLTVAELRAHNRGLKRFR